MGCIFIILVCAFLIIASILVWAIHRRRRGRQILNQKLQETVFKDNIESQLKWEQKNIRPRGISDPITTTKDYPILGTKLSLMPKQPFIDANDGIGRSDDQEYIPKHKTTIPNIPILQEDFD